MIYKFTTYIDTLEKREKFVLLIGVFLVVLIVGVFFIIMPFYEENKKLRKLLQKEIENYNQLIQLAQKYVSIKPSVIKTHTISLSEIEQISQVSGVKNNITSIKPITFEGEKGIEVMMKDVPAKLLMSFLKKIEKANYKIKFISIYDPKGDQKLTVRIVIGV